MIQSRQLRAIAAELREARRHVRTHPGHAYRIADVAWEQLVCGADTRAERRLVARLGQNLARAAQVAVACPDGMMGYLVGAAEEVEAWASRVEKSEGIA